MWRKRQGLRWHLVGRSHLCDYDGDGRLDLFVDGYAKIDLSDLHLRFQGSGLRALPVRNVQVMCGPRGLKGEQDHLFRNKGTGSLKTSARSSMWTIPTGTTAWSSVCGREQRRQGGSASGQRFQPNYLYMNKGDGTFDDQSYESGYAFNKDGREISNMGIAAGDYENNGHLSLVNTSFADDYNVLFQNDGTGSSRILATRPA